MTTTVKRIARPLTAARGEVALQHQQLDASGEPSLKSCLGSFARDTGSEPAALVVTQFMIGDFLALPAEIAGHRVVRSLDPGKWPHPADPDCQKEWDELAE